MKRVTLAMLLITGLVFQSAAFASEALEQNSVQLRDQTQTRSESKTREKKQLQRMSRIRTQLKDGSAEGQGTMNQYRHGSSGGSTEITNQHGRQ